MFRQAEFRSKKKVLLHVEFFSGSSFDGYLFLSQDERISDLLNDDRKFLPFEDLDGGTLKLVAKDSISTIVPKEPQNKRKSEGSFRTDDPYRILGVSQGMEIERIREAYKKRAREFHPDRFSSGQFPSELIEFANDMMSRINQAFQAIQAETNNKRTAQPRHHPQQKKSL